MNYDFSDGPVSFSNSNILDTDKSAFCTKMFGWMFVGLLISAVCALGGALFFGNLLAILYFPLAIVELILVFAFSANINKMSAAAATACFVAYSAINGLTLFSIFYVYELGSIFSAFIVAAAMFGVAALFGAITKKDLSGLGSICLMGLFGLIIIGVLSFFIPALASNLIINSLAVILFTALTAYDVNKILSGNIFSVMDADSSSKLAIYGALQLYLDFINIFLRLLRIFARRKD